MNVHFCAMVENDEPHRLDHREYGTKNAGHECDRRDSDPRRGSPAEARGNGQADAAAGARAFTRRDRREILREAVLR